MSAERNRIDRSMQRDQHARNARRTHFEYGHWHREYDRRNHRYRDYRSVREKDGNGKTVHKTEERTRWRYYR